MAIEQALCPVLVGRDDLLATLEEALLATHRGEGQMVFLVGEAGIGKSRLAGELQRRALKHGTAVMSGGCSEVDLTLPYLPFIEAIGNYLTFRDLDQLRQRLGPGGRELGLLFPQLSPQGVARRGADDASERKLRLFESVLALLRIAAEERALLLVLEDLHWADTSTRELLDYVSRRLRTSRILVVATCRQEELTQQHPLVPMLQGWRRAGVAQVLELGPLPSPGVGEMMQAILDQPVRSEFREFLHVRSEGNPFVVEEFLKAALDRVVRTDAGWDLKVMAELKIPASVRDTILQRVARLSEGQAEILSTAAVIGPAFSYPTLVAVAARPAAEVQAALRTFVQQQLMAEDPQHGERYRFRHALTHEAVYEDVLGPKRAELHGRAADVLRDQLQAPAMDLAHHLLAAQRWEEAVPVCLQAAEETERRSGYREVVDLYERVLPLLRDDRMRGRVLCRLGNARFLSGNPARAQRDLEDGLHLLEQQGEAREAAGFRIQLGICHAQQSRPQLARLEWQRAREALQPAGPTEELAYACAHLASQLGNQWELEAGLALAQEALVVAEQAGASAPRTLAQGAIGIMLTRLGRVAEGLEQVDKSYAEAMDRGLIWIAGNALVNGIAARVEHFRAREALPQLRLLRAMGGAHQLQAARAEGGIYGALGEPVNAVRAWEEALALAREREAVLFVRRSERGLAAAYAALGRLEEARPLLVPRETERERQETFFEVGLAIRILLDGGDVARALHETEAVLASTDWGPLPGRRWLFDVAAEALLEVGRIGEALQLVDQVRGGDGPEPFNPYQARMEGRLALARDELAPAHSLLAEAVEFWAAVGYREEESRTRRALAEVKAREGNPAGAEDELRRVLAYAQGHGAVREGERAGRLVARLGIELPPVESGAPAAPEVDWRQATERVVTVMFVDVRGFTAMTHQGAPHALTERIADFYRAVRREVERRHGLFDHHVGDAVMAIFNVARARLDHCVLALEASIAIRDWAAYAGLPLGVGLAVGPVVVGLLTAGTDMAALGDATNLAARLQAQAGPGEILLSDEAFRRSQDWLRSHALVAAPVTLSLKGIAEPVLAYRLPAGVGSSTPRVN